MGDIVPTQSQTSISAAGIAAMEAYVAAGDIERLAPRERVALYRAVCESLGLNPLTQPFQYLRLSGKTILYATKSCTEQLRMIHGVSVLRMDRSVADDLLTITVSVRDRTGREDISTGVVSLAGLRGDALANQAMKAETKAKRRATLSICGLAMLDETEVETIPGAATVSVEEIHSDAPAQPPAKAGGKARNPAPAASEVAALLDPTPAKPAAPAPTATPSLPSEIVVTREHSLTQVREGLWRLGCQVGGRDVAILDDRIGSALEASQAFGVAVRVALAPRAGGGMRVSEILGDVEEVRI